MNHELLFSRLASLMARYEPGDLTALSDMIDTVSELMECFLHSPECSNFIPKLLDWMRRVMSGGDAGDFIPRLGSALDLLQAWKPGNEAESRIRIEAAMFAFLEEVGADKKASPEAGQQPLETRAAGAAEDKGEQVFQRADIIALFIAEAEERLTQAQELILILEEKPGDSGCLASLFRVFHTIKGESGFLHLGPLGELTHRLENILDLIRNGKLAVDRQIIDVILSGIDQSRILVQEVKDGTASAGISPGLSDFLDTLDRISTGIQPNLGTVLVSSGKIPPETVPIILEKQKEQKFQKRFGEIAVQENLISQADLGQALEQQKQETRTVPEPAPGAESLDEFIKVRLGKVNFLVDMIGELTIALGQVAEHSLAMSQVQKITRSLQFGAMELRTDTMQGLFSVARRLIRDLSHQLDKPLAIQTEGERLEIDRNLIRKLEEPLMHLVRNSLDHGIEKTGDRLAAGKTAEGKISISAVRHGSTITITVEDDGRGLDRSAILAKAVERGLVEPETGEGLTDEQVHDFIFQPGFSTAREISKVSGRGVGMDIVKSMVLANRGTVRLRTTPGKGTAITMAFPISTAIIDGLVVRVGRNSLIIPVGSVIESLKVKTTDLTRLNGDTELITIRERSLPVLRLARVLGFDDKAGEDGQLGIHDGSINPGSRDAPGSQAAKAPKHLIGLIVENSERQRFFFVIDEVIAKKEVVLKPLGPRFRHMGGISAGTVLAGGVIGLVLDVDQVINHDMR